MKTRDKYRLPERIRPIVGGLLLSLLVSEVALRVFDPLGLYIIHRVGVRNWRVLSADTIEPGTYRMVHYAVTLDAEGFRALPERPDADCTLVFIGDSVTFGWRVADEDIFAYQIAEALPDVQFVNTARSAYNAQMLRKVAERTPGDGYVYVAVYNDDLSSLDYDATLFVSQHLALNVYRTSLFTRPERMPIDDWQGEMAAWLDTLPVLIVVPDVEGVAVYDWLREQYEVAVIPPYTSQVSTYDDHPDALGHDEMTDSMLPYVADFAESVCA